jgi:Fe-S oxidoreductase
VIEENSAEIETRYPDLDRVVSGYNLDAVLDTDPAGTRVIDLTELFVGAEGTLGTVVSATLDLVSKPTETALALYCFDDLLEAMRAVPQALEYDVSAVELMDERVFDLAAESAKYADYVEAIPEGTRAALMVEYDNELVSDFEAAVGQTDDRFLVAGAAFDRIQAFDADAQADLWNLRKAAIPLLMSLPGDPKPYPFIEDATVPPTELATYVSGFEEILEAHDTSAAYFAHAGSGTLHIRPILNLKSESGVETMHSIADAVTDLVRDHHGSVSGEHGDGLARTQFNPKMYGKDLWAGFKAIKAAVDPDWRMNPGVVVYRDQAPTDMRDHLRYGPAYSSIEPTTVQSFEAEGGFSHLVELCNGCGTCRQTESEVMCPTFRATQEEIQSTRGRANMLRAAISGEIPPEELYTDRFTSDVLDVCLGCKGCMSDCPTGVDLAKLKVEVKHEYHQREGIGLRERLFARFDELARLGAATAPLSNWLAEQPAIRSLAEEWLGIAADRGLPTFTRDTLSRWDADRTPAVTGDEADREVLLVPDPMSKYADTGPARAAVGVLEAAGCRVEIATDVGSTGRPAYSNGLLDRAIDQASAMVERLAPAVRGGWDIVFIEPSDAVMVQDEYPDLLAGDARAGSVAANTYELLEYVDRHRLDERIDWGGAEGSLTYHGHCHQKATGTDHHAPSVLERAGFAVDELDSSCCGMAGTFGYKAEQYDLSMAVGEVLFETVKASSGERLTVPGTSCRDQLLESAAVDGRPSHPIEILAASR